MPETILEESISCGLFPRVGYPPWEVRSSPPWLARCAMRSLDQGCQCLHTLERRILWGQRAGDPVQYTKEPYRRVMWAIHEMVCSKKGVWEDPKHRTKACGRFRARGPLKTPVLAEHLVTASVIR
jgi:hypothetical protein